MQPAYGYFSAPYSRQYAAGGTSQKIGEGICPGKRAFLPHGQCYKAYRKNDAYGSGEYLPIFQAGSSGKYWYQNHAPAGAE